MDPTPTSVILQVLIGLIISFIIYVISLYVINSDQIVSKDVKKVKKAKTEILKGVLNSSEKAANVVDNTWNTVLPFTNDYLSITPSINDKGGAQFSYSFWLYVGSPKESVGRTLFLKGDKNMYQYDITENYYTPSQQAVIPGSKTTVNDRVIVCPQFMFGSNEMDFEVRFNTFDNINEKMIVKRVRDQNSIYRNNLQSLYPKAWFHIAVTFEDNVPINDFDKGILVRFYLNGTLYQMNKYNSTLRQNRGNFYVFPDSQPIPDCKMSDLAYFNYALPEADIAGLLTNKPSLHSASSTSASQSSPSHTANTNIETNAKNHLDVFNV